MKKFFSVFLMICMMFSLFVCGERIVEAKTENGAASQKVSLDTESTSESETTSAADGTSDESKILIAYFSRADENYGVGVIEKGNTEIIAEMIAEETGGDLFHIERETAYPVEYDACTEEAKQEKENDARPALAEDFSPDEYNVIYLGYPIWWGDMPMPVYTWLEAHDFVGKTIIPFCTHAGSGLSGTGENIQDICADAEILEGFEISGETAQNDQDEARTELLTWMENLDVK